MVKYADVFFDGDGHYAREIGDDTEWLGPHDRIHDALLAAMDRGFIIREVRGTRGNVPPRKPKLAYGTGVPGADLLGGTGKA